MLRRLNQWRHRRPGHILPFRIPFFRIFYSTTYTTLFLLTLVILAITPASLLYTAITGEAFQYVFMIGGTYVLTAIIAIFVYSSRLYTNRSVLVGVGKSYIPVEDGEVGKKVRKMIVAQLERSAVVAWEARPRDASGEILMAEKEGLLPYEEVEGSDADEWTVGRIIPIDPERPPWGDIKHPGWTAPAISRGEGMWNLQFEVVIKELPNLVEAQAVGLAPPDPESGDALFNEAEQPPADALVVEALRRQAGMGMREYLTQLSYLGLVNPPNIGQDFLTLYEQARFSGRPTPEEDFNELMAVFARLLEGMTDLSPDIVAEIRAQSGGDVFTSSSESISVAPSESTGSVLHYATPDPARPGSSNAATPVTAMTAPSRIHTPYLQSAAESSQDSFTSVLRGPPIGEDDVPTPKASPSRRSGYESGLGVASSPRSDSIPSDSGSVLYHGTYTND